MGIISKVIDGIDYVENSSCIGLDPRIESIPDFIKETNLNRYGNTKRAVAKSFFDFNKIIIDATRHLVAAYKPQISFYEKYGRDGIEAFEDTIKYIKKVGKIAIEDGKRNDIGPTAKAYSSGHIGKVELIEGELIPGFDVDYITVNPYLGIDGVKPFVEDCKKYEKGIFVLDKTSNPSSGDLQDKIVFLEPWQIDLIKERLDGTDLKISDLSQMKNLRSSLKADLYNTNILGEKGYYNIEPKELRGVAPNYILMAANIEKWGEEAEEEEGYISVGAVIGATYPEEAKILRKIIPKRINLIPGYGYQSAKARDVMPNFNRDGYGALINNSRGIIFAYLKQPYNILYSEDNFEKASTHAALNMRAELKRAMKGIGIWRY